MHKFLDTLTIDQREPVTAPAEPPRPRRLTSRHLGLLADLIALALFGVVLLEGAPDRRVLAAAGGFVAIIALLQVSRGAYRAHCDAPLHGELIAVVAVTAIAAMGTLALTVLAGDDVGISYQVCWLWLVATVLLVAGRVAETVIRTQVRRRGKLTTPTLIVGAGRVGHLAAQRLVDHPEVGLRPVGFLDSEPLPAPGGAVELPVLGQSWDLEDVVATHGIGHVVIAFSTAPTDELLSIVRRCEELGLAVSVVPRLFEVEGARAVTAQIGALPLIGLHYSKPDGWQRRLKYAVERAAGAVVLLLISPLIAGCALAIRITMGGPIFYRQERVGRNGERFSMIKFRTMSGRPEEHGEADAAWAEQINRGVADLDARRLPGSADRTTAVGRFLRRYSLDEVPQLWNVVRGDMTLIGPRPERASYVERFIPAVYRYADRHRVKPGMTGWAQVNGLRGKTSLQDRVEWDNYYVENWSWLLDLKILCRTPSALLIGESAPTEEAEAASERSRISRRARLRSGARLTLSVLVSVALIALAALAAVSSARAELSHSVANHHAIIKTFAGMEGAER